MTTCEAGQSFGSIHIFYLDNCFIADNREVGINCYPVALIFLYISGTHTGIYLLAGTQHRLVD